MTSKVSLKRVRAAGLSEKIIPTSNDSDCSLQKRMVRRTEKLATSEVVAEGLECTVGYTSSVLHTIFNEKV